VASAIPSSLSIAVSLALLLPFGVLAQSAEPGGSVAPGAAASTAATDVSASSAAAELAWQRVDGLPGPETALVSNIAVGADGTLAVLGQTTVGAGPALGWYSADGLTWEQAKVKDAEFAAYLDLLALPDGGFIAWPFLGAQLWRSPDGRTWKRDKRPGSVFFGDGIATEDGLVFVGQTPDRKPTALRSTDGKKWSATELPAAEGGDDLPNLIVRLADGTLLAAATGTRDAAATLWRSVDGTEWQIVPMPDTEPGAFIGGIAPSATGAVMVVPHLSETGVIGSTIWATTDGTDWQAVHESPEVWLSTPVPGPGATYVWAGSALLSSTDGLTWTESRPEAFDGPYTVFGGAVTPDGELVTIGRVEAIKGSATWLGSPAAE
jgi:hypothetical protein